MKIVCDSCGAKYSIADEKVAGRVFKIRCKKCSAAIVVRGDQLHGEQPEANADVQPTDAVWHLVLEGEQQGPFSPAQVGDMLQAGTADADTYVWREGFEGWVAAREVPELQGVLSSGAPAQEPVAAAAAAPMAEAQPAAAQPQASFAANEPQQADFGGGSMFGAATAGADAGLGAASSASGGADAGAGLFAQVDSASPFRSAGGGEPASTDAGGGSMTGQRNENSVLFSLSNLQALATGSEASAAAPSSPPSNGSTMAQGEGSGLIDIRALASAAQGTPAGAGALPLSSGNPAPDDVLSIGAGASALGSALTAPVLSPAVAEPERSNKGLIIGAAIGAGGLVAAAGILVLWLGGKDAATPVQTAMPTAPQAALGAAPAQPTAAQPGAEKPSAAAPGTTGSDTAKPAKDSDGQPSSSSRTRSSRRSRSRSASSEASKPTGTSKPEPKPRKTGANGNLDDLMNEVLGGGSKAKKSSSSSRSTANLPDAPGRDAVRSALMKVQKSLSSCNGTGVARTAITVRGSTGRVSGVQVTGDVAGTPAAACVKRQVRKARFPRFKRSSFSVNFPFRL